MSIEKLESQAAEVAKAVSDQETKLNAAQKALQTAEKRYKELGAAEAAGDEKAAEEQEQVALEVARYSRRIGNAQIAIGAKKAELGRIREQMADLQLQAKWDRAEEVTREYNELAAEAEKKQREVIALLERMSELGAEGFRLSPNPQGIGELCGSKLFAAFHFCVLDPGFAPLTGSQNSLHYGRPSFPERIRDSSALLTYNRPKNQDPETRDGKKSAWKSAASDMALPK